MPTSGVIPVIAYPDVAAAANWLCAALGFEIRLRIADHRIQLERDGAWIVAKKAEFPTDSASRCTIMLRVEDIQRVSKTAAALGGKLEQEPTTRAYGECQCSMLDPWGMGWTLSQTMADVAPEEWLESQ